MAEEKKLIRWSNTAVTDIGTQLLTEYAAGRLLDITNAFGSIGTPGDNLFELENLADGRAHPLTIESVTKTKNSVTVCVQVTSLGNPTAYKLERIGIYAVTRDPGTPKPPKGTVISNDKLLMVVEDMEDENGSKGVTVPAETDQLYTFKLYVVLAITNQDRLEVSVSTAGIATIGAIQDAISAHSDDPNAHPGLAARVRAAETAIHGSETLTGSRDPTAVTVGRVKQHYINLLTGGEFVCTAAEEDAYTWEPFRESTSLRDSLEAVAADVAEINKVIGGGASGGNTIEITFEDVFLGQTYTVTDGDDTVTGTVPESLSASVKARNCNSTYTIKATTAGGVEYSTTVATGAYYGQYTATLAVFNATIYVTAVSGAEVTATCGDAVYTAEAGSGGVAAVSVTKAGTYTVQARYAGVVSNTAEVTVNEQGDSYTAAVRFVTLKIKAPAGSLVTLRKKSEEA